MYEKSSRMLLAVLLYVGTVTPAKPQPPQGAESEQQSLAEFEGHYEYRDGDTLFMVARGENLVAIIGESPYVLRVAGTDTFTNPSGQPIPFLRDSQGRITSFKEGADSFARLSPDVPAATHRLFEPRPLGPDGLPVVYRYAPPPRLSDGSAQASRHRTRFRQR